jgi:hypothetical protein
MIQPADQHNCLISRCTENWPQKAVIATAGGGSLATAVTIVALAVLLWIKPCIESREFGCLVPLMHPVLVTAYLLVGVVLPSAVVGMIIYLIGMQVLVNPKRRDYDLLA